jgi:hypothetical protein
MIIPIVVERAGPGRPDETWWFRLCDGNLVLWSYAEWRLTRRNKRPVEPTRVYDRDRPAEWERLAREGQGWLPPLPDDVVAEAKERARVRIAAEARRECEKIRAAADDRIWRIINTEPKAPKAADLDMLQQQAADDEEW